MTCPALAPGSVTNQSGSVNGTTPTYADACSDRQWTGQGNWQNVVWISTVAGVGDHYQHSQVVRGEDRVLAALLGANTAGTPVPFPALGQHDVGVNWVDGAGNTYKWLVTHIAYSANNCHHTEKTATAGTVTLQSIDDGQVTADYSVTFGSAGSLSGSLVAPRAATAGSLYFNPDGSQSQYGPECPTRVAETCINP